jgi:hypothetical protein
MIYTDVTYWKKLSISVGSFPCVPNYCACKVWKKLSISVVGHFARLACNLTVPSGRLPKVQNQVDTSAGKSVKNH